MKYQCCCKHIKLHLKYNDIINVPETKAPFTIGAQSEAT